MFMGIWKWWRRKNGYHVCEEFTQWKVCTKVRVVIGIHGDTVEECQDAAQRLHDMGHWTHRWLERNCTICGMVEQKELDL